MLPLLFLDLDGTLIGASGTVSGALWDGLAELAGRGVHPSVCTGRPGLGVAWRVAARLSEMVEAEAPTPHIFLNGSLIATVDATGLEVLESEPLPEPAIEALVERARRDELTLELYTAEAVYVDVITPECRRHADVLGLEVVAADLEEVRRHERILKAHWIIAPGRAEQLGAEIPEGCEGGYATSSAIPGVAFISITRRGASKGDAVERVAKRLDIPLERAMAIGDSVGDLAMLEAVGHPVVMGDADHELRGRFPSVGDAEDDGVLAALEWASER